MSVTLSLKFAKETRQQYIETVRQDKTKQRYSQEHINKIPNFLRRKLCTRQGCSLVSLASFRDWHVLQFQKG